MREIADEVGAVFMVDMAHFAGLVAGKVFTGDYDPVAHAHVVTTTTHKTLRGPRGGMVLCERGVRAWVDKGCPAILGGPLPHVMAAKAVALREALDAGVPRPTPQGSSRTPRRWPRPAWPRACTVLTGGTDNHLLLLDVGESFGLTGRQAESALRACGITLNRNSLPVRRRTAPGTPAACALGTPAVTTLGMGAAEMREIAASCSRCPRRHHAGHDRGRRAVSKARYKHRARRRRRGRQAGARAARAAPALPELDLDHVQPADFGLTAFEHRGAAACPGQIHHHRRVREPRAETDQQGGAARGVGAASSASSASGIEAAEVLPAVSMSRATTQDSGSSRSATIRSVIRALAWCGTNAASSTPAEPGQGQRRAGGRRDLLHRPAEDLRPGHRHGRPEVGLVAHAGPRLRCPISAGPGPSDPQTDRPDPRLPAPGSTTTAPAPSANRNASERSAGSMMSVILSEPITSTCRALPAQISPSAIAMPVAEAGAGGAEVDRGGVAAPTSWATCGAAGGVCWTRTCGQQHGVDLGRFEAGAPTACRRRPPPC